MQKAVCAMNELCHCDYAACRAAKRVRKIEKTTFPKWEVLKILTSIYRGAMAAIQIPIDTSSP